MRPPNLFYRLVTDEDSFTEAFVNALSNGVVRKSLVDFLRSRLPIGDLSFDYADISTQSVGKERERPDIVVENAKVYLAIENKIHPYTELTGNQPTGYLRRLSTLGKERARAIVFLVPREYRHTQTILERYEAALDSVKDGIHFAIVFWEELLDAIETAISERWFNDFVDLARDLMNYRSYPLDENDMQTLSNHAGSFVKLIHTVDNARRLLSSMGFKIDEEVNEYSYGFHLRRRSDGAYLLYIGILYAQWVDRGEPLYFGFSRSEYDPKVIEAIEAKVTRRHKDFEEGWEYGTLVLKEIASQNDPAVAIADRVVSLLQ